MEVTLTKENNQNVLNALKYINDNITSPITLTDVSSAIHISKGHTTRIFKKEMGMTVSQYINKQKIILAKDMLTSKELSIQDIAHLIGYENYGYFNKIFTSHFGMSPVKMKSQLKNK
jgi:two-component system response regulator YesN